MTVYMDIFIINAVNILRSLMFEAVGTSSLKLNVFKNPHVLLHMRE
jgi:hypothetical protein